MASLLFERKGIRVPRYFEAYWNRWSLAFEFIFDHDSEAVTPWMLHVHFLIFSAFIHFPFWVVPKSNKERWQRDWQRWGLSLCDDSLHLSWNERSKVIWLPWFHKVHQRHEVRRADGTWVPFVGSWEQKEPDGREEFVYPYTYKLRSGEVQNRTAKVFVERRAWRPKWFEWTSLFEKSRQVIDVEFSDEVGERTGSWKGGCVGCGYEMLPGETPEQTLRRMERERIFK